MKTTTKTLSLLLISSILIISSCKKNDTGGEASVHARIVHDGEEVIGSNIIYVKFNATKQPENPTGNYDLKVDGEAGENHVHIAGLRPGKYYFYTESFDSTSLKHLHGGATATIKWSEKDMMKDLIIETEH